MKLTVYTCDVCGEEFKIEDLGFATPIVREVLYNSICKGLPDHPHAFHICEECFGKISQFIQNELLPKKQDQIIYTEQKHAN